MAEPDVWKLVGLFLVIVIAIAMFSAVATIILPSKCTDENNKIADLTSQINILNTKNSELNKTAIFYQEQYNNLTTTTVTKKDFTDMQNQISILTIQVNDTKTQVINMNQQVTNIQNINTIRYTLSFFIFFDFAFISVTVLDILLFRGKYIRKISNRIYSWRNKTEVQVNHSTYNPQQ
jgi:hypothetical protein